jgi:hemerythrin-like domain-containing protein
MGAKIMINRECIFIDRYGRRRLLRAILSGAALVISGFSPGRSRAQDNTRNSSSRPEEVVSPGEDLMREHGVLKRILLVYEEAARRLEAAEELPPETLINSAGIIRSFIEDYHEKLEENFLFPRFRKANRLVDLVDVLQEQHKAGRRLTDETLRLATFKALKNPDDRRTLVDSLRQFIRMYNPHEAREDTVLFPAIHEVFAASEYDKLGEDFERKEQELFGEGGFENIVNRVAAIEKGLGINDLGQFTPKGP